MQDPLLIIGTGMAGYMLAQQWRQLDKETPLVIVTSSEGNHYSKPMLSTACALGKSPEALVMKSAEVMAEELDARVITGVEVTSLDVANRVARWDGGEQAFSRCVLAVGAETQALQFPVADDAKVWRVNQWEEYRDWRACLGESPRRIAIVGAGLVGCEFAHDLAAAGHEVQVFFDTEAPLPKLLPTRMGQAFADSLRDQLGIQWHSGCLVSEVRRCPEGGEEVVLTGGEVHRADHVLAATGLEASTSLAKQAGLACATGIQVDAYGEASVSGIYALGDCAELDGLCLQYVMPIRQQSAAMAKTLAGEPQAIHYPVMAVTVKTPRCSVLTTSIRPEDVGRGEWTVTGEGSSLVGRYEVDGKLKTVAALGAACRDRSILQPLPELLSDPEQS